MLQFAETLNVLVAANSLPVKTVPDFIVYARGGDPENPRSLRQNDGTAGSEKSMAFQDTEILIRSSTDFRKKVRESMVDNAGLVKTAGLKATD